MNPDPHVRKPLKESPEYIYGSAAGQIIYNELKHDRYRLRKFARKYADYCRIMNALADLKPEYRIFQMQLNVAHTQEVMRRLFDDKRLPKKLLSFALNAVSYIHKKHIRGNKFNTREWKDNNEQTN